MTSLRPDKTFFSNLGPGVVDLRVGAPGPEDWGRAHSVFTRSAARLEPETLMYGPARGPKSFLEALRAFLDRGYSSARRPAAPSGSLFATGGATAGLWLCASVLLRRSSVVFVESPTYFIALDILRGDLGHRVVPVRMERDGVDVKELERKIVEEKQKREEGGGGVGGDGDGKRRFWAMFYTVPTFHNPTGAVLSPEKSSRLVELARKHDVLIFCDDVYNLLNYGGEKHERLLAYEDPNSGPGHVVSNGSFSKILGPGLRLGWLEAAPDLIARVADETGIVRSAGCLNNVTAGVVGAAMESGLAEEHLGQLKKKYLDRIGAVHKVFEDNLPEGFSCAKPIGGYFMWITGPESFSASAFAESLAEAHNIHVLPGSSCGLREGGEEAERRRLDRSFRVCFAFYEKEILVEAAKKICLDLKKN